MLQENFMDSIKIIGQCDTTGFCVGIVLFCLCLFSLDTMYAQQPADKESTILFQKAIPYCEVQTSEEKTVTLKFDLYEPVKRTNSLRPLVITLFGGGFVVGSRDYEDMVAWCRRFAENGYVAASIDYSLMSPTQFSSSGLIRTGYMAAQDVSAAVRFFKANSETYHIDTNRIFLLGESAGAVAIIHALYMDEDERPEETFADPALSPLHSLGTDDVKAKSFRVAGAILLWGSIFDLEMIDPDEKTPVCMIHGAKDKILPIDSGYAFSLSNLPYVYGSRAMADRMKAVGTIPFEFHQMDEESHAFYFKYLYMFQIDQQKFDICWNFVDDFLHRLRPE